MRISDWSSDVCSSDLLPFQGVHMSQTLSSSVIAPRTGRWLAVAAVVASMAMLGGCANRSASSGVYSFDQAQREQIVRIGTVTGVRPITKIGRASGRERVCQSV